MAVATGPRRRIANGISAFEARDSIAAVIASSAAATANTNSVRVEPHEYDSVSTTP